MRVTVRVEVGDGAGALVLRGREVQALEARHVLGEHARCRLTFDRGAGQAAGGAGGVTVRALLDAPIRVLVVRQDTPGGGSDGAAEEGAGAAPGGYPAGTYVAFEGRVARVREIHRPHRASRYVVLARSASAALGAQRRQRRYPAHTVAAVAQALGARAADLPAPPGDPLSYVQDGETDWQFLSRLAAEEGLMVRAAWPWGGAGDGADGGADDGGSGGETDGGGGAAVAEVRAGFAAVTHGVTWGVDLLALATDARVAAPAVSGAHYDADQKHDHRYRGVRGRPSWLDGAAAAVAAVEAAARAGGVTDGPGLVPAGVRAPTLGAFRSRLERASERRLGSAVVVVGRSTAPGLVAGDRLRVEAASGAGNGAGNGAGGATNGEADGAAGGSPGGPGAGWRLDAGGTAGVYGLVAVRHVWDGAQYENAFAATPWAGYHPAPPGADAAERVAPSAGALGELLAATPALGRAGTGAEPAAFGGGRGVGGGVGSDRFAALGGGGGLLHGDDRAATDAALLALAAGEHDGAGDADQGLGGVGSAGLPAGLAGGGGLRLALGLVTDNADPSGQGRVRVRMLWQDGEEAGGGSGGGGGERAAWARVASVMAGRDRGLGSLPEVGDEVVCGFLAGDPERPVVLGSLWNGKDTAAHTPRVRHWKTRAGNAVVLDDTGGRERVELHTPEGRTMVQLAAVGPGGAPLVTVHSQGDVSLEAPDGQVRITAKTLLVHTTQDVAVEARGALTHKAEGAVTVASGAALGLKAGADVKLAAGGQIAAHAAGSHRLSGSQVTLNPPGAAAPQVTAQVPAAPPSAWEARPVPAPGPGRSTEDPKAPPPRARPERKDERDLVDPSWELAKAEDSSSVRPVA